MFQRSPTYIMTNKEGMPRLMGGTVTIARFFFHSLIQPRV